MSCCTTNPVIYYNSSTFSSGTTGIDVLVPTLDTTLMPIGTKLPSLTLPTDGSYIEIVISGIIPNTSNRILKLEMGSSTNNIFTINGNYTGPYFSTTITLVRNAYNVLRWKAITNFNSTQTLITTSADFNCDLTTDISTKFYINQSVGNSLTITELKITKFIK